MSKDIKQNQRNTQREALKKAKQSSHITPQAVRNFKNMTDYLDKYLSPHPNEPMTRSHIPCDTPQPYTGIMSKN